MIEPIRASIRRFSLVEKIRTTNQLASLVQRDYLHLDAFWRVNLGTYVMIFVIFITDLPDSVLIL